MTATTEFTLPEDVWREVRRLNRANLTVPEIRAALKLDVNPETLRRAMRRRGMSPTHRSAHHGTSKLTVGWERKEQTP